MVMKSELVLASPVGTLFYEWDKKMKDMIILLLIGIFYVISILVAYNIGRSTARRYSVDNFLNSLKHHSDWENHLPR